MRKMVTKKITEEPILASSFDRRLLDYYRLLWEGLAKFRKESERAVRYFSGDQWHDKIQDDAGNWIREDENITAQGKPALKQNLIKSTIKSMEGMFRTDTSKSVVVARTPEKAKESEMLSNALQYSLTSVNSAKDLDARALEEFLNTGLAVQRLSWEYMPEFGKYDAMIRNINRNGMFWNGDIEDIRGFDIRVIGRLIDSTVEDLIVNFGITPERTQAIKDIYQFSSRQYYQTLDANSPEYLYHKDFYIPADISKCRVIEVWEKRLVEQLRVHDWMDGMEKYFDWTPSQLEQANQLRIQAYAGTVTDEYPNGIPAEEVPLMEGEKENVMKWFYTYYSPYGHVLREGETPFLHGSHPFVITPYPLLDGKISGLTSDLIDAQRQVNRLLILQDMILSSSVKNTLIVDQDAMDGKTAEEIGNDYKKIGGVIIARLKPGQRMDDVAKELKGSVGNLGIAEMIQIYIRMLQDVSGVHPAMQGQSAASGTSGTLYNAQIMQGNLNSKDIMDTFTGLFRRNRDMKLLQTIHQYYDKPVMLAIAGKSYTETAQLYDPEQVKDIQYDLVIGQTADSPVYRTIIEDTLVKFVEGGLIDLTMFLENTSLPFSQGLLESLRKRQEQAKTDPRAAVAGAAQDVQNAGVGGDQKVINAVSQNLKAA